MNRVDIETIEVVQVIQAPGNPVYEPGANGDLPPRSRGIPLVAGRRTFARVYVSNLVSRRDVRARGTLSVKVVGEDGGHEVHSVGTVDWPARGALTVASQRGAFATSLNFELPAAACVDGPERELEIIAIEDEHAGQRLRIGSSLRVRIRFQPAPALACRVLAMHYVDDETDELLAPTDPEIDLVRRYVSRTFPVASVRWSTRRVQADSGFRSLGPVDDYVPAQDEIASRGLSRLLAQLLAHRNQEVRAGRPENTIYLGLIADPNGRFGGVAMDASPFPTTHNVAVSAVDDTGETAAHELGHLLGRHHPGIPDANTHGFELGQFRVDERARFEIGSLGHLSPGDHAQDAGDAYLGLDASSSYGAPRVVAHDRYYDLMTYRYPQWVSAYTYRALFDRLSANTRRTTSSAGRRHWTAICHFDLSRKSARFVHVLESAFITPQHPDCFEDVDEYAATRALDYVYWLNDEQHVFSPTQWNAVEKVVSDVLSGPDRSAARSSSEASDTPTVSIAQYNLIMEKLLTHADTGIGRILRENDAEARLCDPSIRVFVAQRDDDSAPDAATMWCRASAVYHRGVGDPARFPFGLFQCTLSGPVDNAAAPRSATLMIDGVVVDRFEPALSGSEADRVAEAIFDVLETTFGADTTDASATTDCDRTSVTPRYPDPPGEPPSGRHDTPPAPNGLYYDVVEDGYFLHYEWPDVVVDALSRAARETDRDGTKAGAAVTTTIYCLPPCAREGQGEDWEVVYVGDALYGRVWIAPALLEFEYRGRRPYCPGRPFAPPPSRPIGSRQADTLTFKVEIATGFETYASREFTAKPRILSPARKDFFRPITTASRRHRVRP